MIYKPGEYYFAVFDSDENSVKENTLYYTPEGAQKLADKLNGLDRGNTYMNYVVVCVTSEDIKMRKI